MAAAPLSGPQIPEFYAGRSIFITGATGFMGKVLVERLLSTCPDIGRLYLLMRTKKDVGPERRLQVLKESKVFDVLKRTSPWQLDKLVLVPGDVTAPHLGIPPEYLAQLHEVSVVFHSAATLKFDEELLKAVEQNVRSVIRVMDLCDRLPHVEAFVHVSTAYSNCDRDYVEERVYDAPVPLDQLLSLVDSAPPHLLTEITDKYIAPKPNTYTFTKAIAENVVQQHGNRGYSVAIFRPSIVVSSYRHPFPGWMENLNGPTGVAVAAGKGLLHVFTCKACARADLIPVDICIDTLIAAGWETATDRLQEVRVYNCSTYDNPITWGEFELSLRKYLLTEYPLDQVLWYPYGSSVESKYVVSIFGFLLHTVPMYLAEYGSRLLGIKRRVNLIIAEQKMRSLTRVLEFFSLKEFHFDTSNVRRLRARLSPDDASIYNLDVGTIDWDDACRNFAIGTRRYLLGEKDEDLAEAKRHLKRMWFLHTAVTWAALLLFIRLLLRSSYIREFIYGALKLMVSLFTVVYSSALQKIH